MKKKIGGTIKTSIGEHYSEYIEKLIASGRYLTVAEILREALRIHEIHHDHWIEKNND